MKNNTVYLTDIKEAIEKIEKYTFNVDFEHFKDDDMQQDAVIRQFMVIGEATNRLSSDFYDEHPDFPAREAVGMRNLLIHGYDEVNVEVVWKTLQQDIPLLKEKVLSILS
ncbi:hypothetical protein A3B02_00545 [Candidatus Roizmanbacteria bacterium RIFCSPLOWO2_01_FULL_42_14]|uniref:DUF86 domain-containing protein n=3 Tax=Candidatus Roizmaniibacteriota TaxID=1752723 RepID=A0A1F7K039_9BACT|nr:MAG: hypothetical protein A3F32_00920 [Candidatus Roizmanbacteria bacterium RIFCSPHIGHO2_12_FULL_42_10]OGK52742.1 MAG: hypothetical protein A3B02_00545 [Candidatus Roizmanbacteria bacterium RIFCSPLOWO2_01_FULL_42_14]OGK61209.1 MAG: hypothetical protein A3I56_03905 [Candidatus Roizmanbacteria bacterium RIFCSPLOWO2_02_FULL_43_10]